MEARTEIELDWQIDLQGYAQTSCSTKQNTDKANMHSKNMEGRQKEKKMRKIKNPPGRLLFNLFHAIP